VARGLQRTRGMSLFTSTRHLWPLTTLAALSWSTGALADTAAAPTPPAALPVMSPPPANVAPPGNDSSLRPILGEQTTYQAPNGPLLLGGVALFLGSYAPAVIAAAVVNTSFDNNLYIPLVGPWLDIANRPSCGGRLEPRCTSEGGRKAILAVDGVLQGVGAVATVMGLVLAGKHTEIVTARADRTPKAHLSVVPSQMGRDGYGVVAFGDF
jgi:hypothetical protein